MSQPSPSPESQPPDQPPELRPQPPSAGPPSSSARLVQTLAQTWQFLQPVLLRQSIVLLRGTIQLLNLGLNRLEAVATDKGVSTTLATPSFWLKLQPFLHQLWQQWQKLLGFLRSRLPDRWQTWSDPALTGGVAALLVLFFWITSALIPDHPSAPVAPRPLPVAIAPAPLEPVAEPEPVVVPSPVAVEPPPVPAAPEIPPPPEPEPIVELSPEQARIAEIQSQFNQVTDTYGKGLLAELQVNFAASRLRLQLDNHWYDLNATRQDQLAQEVLQRAQDLDFNRLEIIDGQGDLVAREPVIGTEAIVLKRRLV
uniref:Uncharacterized protein n=1 Tax=Cyanothece sp. (strain PCC 7425 / ATCC 29141) TaxID=395961 RepID=B8HPV9_CYAP4